jgi:hypothetical protein
MNTTDFKDSGVRYKRMVQAIGRNGRSKCKGINLLRIDGVVHMVPVNSRDEDTHCDIQIPAESIKDLIVALQQLEE